MNAHLDINTYRQSSRKTLKVYADDVLIGYANQLASVVSHTVNVDGVLYTPVGNNQADLMLTEMMYVNCTKDKFLKWLKYRHIFALKIQDTETNKSLSFNEVVVVVWLLVRLFISCAS